MKRSLVTEQSEVAERPTAIARRDGLQPSLGELDWARPESVYASPQFLELADVRLVVDGGRLRAHSQVLAQASGVLRELFRAQREGGQAGVMELKAPFEGRSVQEVALWLRFVYRAGDATTAALRAPPVVAHLPGVLRLSHALDCEQLLAVGEAALTLHLDKDPDAALAGVPVAEELQLVNAWAAGIRTLAEYVISHRPSNMMREVHGFEAVARLAQLSQPSVLAVLAAVAAGARMTETLRYPTSQGRHAARKATQPHNDAHLSSSEDEDIDTRAVGRLDRQNVQWRFAGQAVAACLPTVSHVRDWRRRARADSAYDWRIDAFKEKLPRLKQQRQGSVLCSPVFRQQSCGWQLQLRVAGREPGCPVGIYLTCTRAQRWREKQEPQMDDDSQQIEASFAVSLVAVKGTDRSSGDAQVSTRRRAATATFRASGPFHGWTQFIPLQEMLDDFVVQNSLTLRCEVTSATRWVGEAAPADSSRESSSEPEDSTGADPDTEPDDANTSPDQQNDGRE